MNSIGFRDLANNAAAFYRPSGRFAHGFARGKLLSDPVFEHILRHGLLGRARRVLDLGCGQGLLAALILCAQQSSQAGQWPVDWQEPPRFARVHGIDLMSRDVARANAALGNKASIVQGDIADLEFGQADTVVILDVLHYLPFDKQLTVLDAVRDAIGPGGNLLLRIGDADAGLGFRYSNWVDRVVTWCRGHRLGQLYCRSLSEWVELLNARGFQVDVQPMSEGTLFSNVLLIARQQETP